ncbi:potassium-transporting ATPase subunit KdpC [Sphingomonas sp.]|uniref:potassium-transporting ATPase subunit KdpC n=1 Tax=Sphingomonas sp. TaxID=28214 RepID=UPI002FD8C871
MHSDLVSGLRPAFLFTLIFAALLGIAYPLVITGAGQLLFPAQANGSLVRDGAGQLRGSALLGQNFAAARYFQGRPSAAGNGYDPLASGGSNMGPASKKLIDRVRADQTRLGANAPADLLLASGSGLDPDISPAAARFQVARVAKVRGIAAERIRQLVEANVRPPLLGIIGAPRVNVLALNLALDRQGGAR